MKNICNKVRKIDNPYEIWRMVNGWLYYVLRKYQADDNKPYARWHCFVYGDYDEFGDVYSTDIMNNAVCIYKDPNVFGQSVKEEDAIVMHKPLDDYTAFLQYQPKIEALLHTRQKVYIATDSMYGPTEYDASVKYPSIITHVVVKVV